MWFKERVNISVGFVTDGPAKLVIEKDRDGQITYYITIPLCIALNNMSELLDDLTGYMEGTPQNSLWETDSGELRWAIMCEMGKYEMDPVITYKTIP